MGYTHYFEQMKPAEPAAWQAICDDFRKMMATALLSQPLPIQREAEDAGQPRVMIPTSSSTALVTMAMKPWCYNDTAGSFSSVKQHGNPMTV